MGKVTISHTRTSKHEVKRIFREMMEQFDPEESLDEVMQDLKTFEREFGMSTVEFDRQYVAGKMGDSAKVMAWAGAYESYVHLMQTFGR